MNIYHPGRPHKCIPNVKTFVRPPSVPGEYRIRNANNEIVYIGETNNLNRRLHEHIHSGKMSEANGASRSFEYQIANPGANSELRREHERQKIAQHHPALNKSRGGEGRPAHN